MFQMCSSAFPVFVLIFIIECWLGVAPGGGGACHVNKAVILHQWDIVIILFKKR